MSDNLYATLAQMWAAKNNPYHRQTSATTDAAKKMTPYERARLEQDKIEEANKIRLAQMRLQEAQQTHQASSEDRRYRMAIELQARMADYEMKKEAARQKYFKMYEDAQKAALEAWTKQNDQITSQPKSQHGAFKEKADALTIAKAIVTSNPFTTRQLPDNVLNNKLNTLDPTTRQAMFQRARPAMQTEIIDLVRQFNSLPVGSQQRADFLKKLDDDVLAATNLSREGQNITSEQISALLEERNKYRPKLLSEDPQAGLAFAQRLANQEYSQNPYNMDMIARLVADRNVSQQAQASAPSPLQIAGYATTSHGSQAIPVAGASDEDIKLIDKFNTSPEAKRGGVASNEEMVSRLQKFVNRGM